MTVKLSSAGVYYNEEKLNKAIDWFAHFVTQNQYSEKVDFYKGYMERAEGYKREIYTNAHAALQLEKWSANDIGTHRILSCVISAMNAKDNKNFNNIIDYHGVTHIETTAETNIFLSEDILFRLFTSDDVENAFSDACAFFGKRYPELSYLLFIRDCKKYLPVKNSKSNHYDRFTKMGFPTDCLSSCSWDNYRTFLLIHQFIRQILENTFDCPVSLLDAHSFVWTLYHASEDLSYSDIGIQNENTDKRIFLGRVSESVQFSKDAEKLATRIDIETDSLGVAGIEKNQIIKLRVNQGIFRKRLLRRYSKCCLCGVQNDGLLVASHIKPWAACAPHEKLDTDNGLLLCPNHDKLFDQGWITFDNDGKIFISDRLSKIDRLFLNVSDNMTIPLFCGNEKYLNYHRENVFK